MKKIQKGYTAFELMFVMIMFVALGLIAAAIYVAVHFLAMVW